MPDPDRTARELMDAPGTRVTPEPDEHRRSSPKPEPDARGESGPARLADPRSAAAPADLTATEGGTGTSGSRGGGPAADFSDSHATP